jgi:hypothetical protein
MDEFNTFNYTQYSDLPLEKFDSFNFSVYVLDKEWNYLFVNLFVTQNLGVKGHDLVGKNMWQVFPELKAAPAFIQLKTNTDKGLDSQIVAASPLNSQRLSISGRILNDCNLFTSTILPKKEELLHELRNVLVKK